MWIPREIADCLKETAATRPSLLVTGCRQAGKTSVLERTFPDYGYVSLDLPRIAEEAEHSGEAFLARHTPPLIIDEVPALAACALFARGETVVGGAEELRVKESDRISSIAHMVRAFDGSIEDAEDGFTVHGRSGCAPAEVDTFGDHRIAMAASIIALATKGKSVIRNAQCVHISFPDFFEVLENISW